MVVKVDEQTFWDIKNFPEQYEYIELTDDWFLRFGFERVGIFAEFRKKNITLGFVAGNGQQWQLIINRTCTEVILRHVHKLQNIYFHLKDEEL